MSELCFYQNNFRSCSFPKLPNTVSTIFHAPHLPQHSPLVAGFHGGGVTMEIQFEGYTGIGHMQTTMKKMVGILTVIFDRIRDIVLIRTFRRLCFFQFFIFVVNASKYSEASFSRVCIYVPHWKIRGVLQECYCRSLNVTSFRCAFDPFCTHRRRTSASPACSGRRPASGRRTSLPCVRLSMTCSPLRMLFCSRTA